MPKKRLKDMSAIEKKHHSLEAKAFRSTIMGAIVLGIAALIIGLSIYTYTLVHQYITEAFNLSKSAAAILREVTDVEPLSTAVLNEYRSLSEEEREQSGTDEYRERFASYTQREDYTMIRKVLTDFVNAVDIDDIYLAMYDRESNALVYIADPDDDPETYVKPVDWDPVTEKEVNDFLDHSGGNVGLR